MIPLIDTHAHLLRPEVAAHAWVDGVPALAGRRFGLSAYMEAIKGQGVVQSLLMEGGADESDWQAETHSLNDIANSEDQIAATIVAGRPEHFEAFYAWMDKMPLDQVRGVRRPLHVCDDDLSRGVDFRRSLRLLGEAGLTFDLCVRAAQLPIATELAGACLDTVFILDHAGHPDIAGGDLTNWCRDIAQLALEPNVVCKISGLLPLCAPGALSLEALRPCLDHLLHSFGPDRLLWGGDWPLVTTAADLGVWITLTRGFLAELTPSEAHQIGWETAAQVYSVPQGEMVLN